jgi:hypothetical protein
MWSDSALHRVLKKLRAMAVFSKVLVASVDGD